MVLTRFDIPMICARRAGISQKKARSIAMIEGQNRSVCCGLQLEVSYHTCHLIRAHALVVRHIRFDTNCQLDSQTTANRTWSLRLLFTRMPQRALVRRFASSWKRHMFSNKVGMYKTPDLLPHCLWVLAQQLWHIVCRSRCCSKRLRC